MAIKLKLRPVNHAPGNTSKWCGPSAISILTGMPSGDAARLIRLENGGNPVKGTGEGEMTRALKRCGILVHGFRQYGKQDNFTIAAWLRATHGHRRGRFFLLSAGEHWQLVSGNRFVCGITKEPVNLTHPKVRRRARIFRVYELTAPAGVMIPKEAPKANAPKRDDSAIREFRRFIKSIGSTYRLERDGCDIIDVIVAPCAVFPHGIGTTHHGWDDSLNRLQDAVKYPDRREPRTTGMEWWSE